MARQGRKSVAGGAAAFFAAVSLSFFFFSCAGAPVARLSEKDAFYRLGSGARAYTICDAPALKPLIRAVAADSPELRRVSDALDRTDSAAIAWFGDELPRFRGNAFGSYPRFGSALSLTFSPDWKRVGGKDPYWRSSSGLSLSFEPDGSVLFADGRLRPSDPGPEPDPSFYLLPADAALRVWMPDPASAVSRALGPAGASIRLPIASLSLSLSASGASYRIDLIARAPSEREARALSSLLRFARNLVREDDGDIRTALIGKALRSQITVDGDLLSCTVDSIDPSAFAELLRGSFGTLLKP